jgi:restriction system protein
MAWEGAGDLLSKQVSWLKNDRNGKMPKQSDSAPEFVKFVGPVIAALGDLGGSGRPEEVRSAIAKALNISEKEQARPLPSAFQSRFENQVHWLSFYHDS